MANLPESNTWEPVRQWETTDPALGGADTLFTTPVRNLTNRTKYLKTLLDNVIAGTTGLVGKLLDGSTCENNFSGPQQADTKVASTAFVQSAVALKGGRRNLLINGAMEISQRGDGWTFGQNEGSFVQDRWYAKAAANTGDVIRVYKDNNLLEGDLDGFKYCMKVAFNSASTSLEIRQRINNGRTLENSKATLQLLLSLSADCNLTAKLSRFLNQAQIDAGTPEWTSSETITGREGIDTYVKVFTIPSIVTNVTPDLDDDGCLEVSLTFNHAAGAALTAGLTNVQLERGEIQGQFEERDDLAECLNYFEKVEVHERYEWPISSEGTMKPFHTRQYWRAKRAVPRLTYENETLTNVDSFEYNHIGRGHATLQWLPTVGTQIVTYREIDMDLMVDAEI